MIVTKKLKLICVGDKDEIDRIYKYIRDEQYNQYRALNLAMSYLATADMIDNFEGSEQRKLIKDKNDLNKKIEKSKESEKVEIQKEIEKINENLSKIKTNDLKISETLKEKYIKDLYNSIGIINFIHQDVKSLVVQKVKNDYKTISKEFKEGKRSISNYKKDFPLLTRGRDLKFFHNLENDNEIANNFLKGNFRVLISWIQKIKFEIVLGEPQKSNETRHTLKNILLNNYKVCDSSIKIKDKSIILNLSVDIPITEKELDPNITVGVDLGIAIPAVCALNCNDYIKKSIGNINDFLRIRTKIQAQKRQEQKRLKSVKGGKGRNKKLKALDRFAEKERNFVKSYNHFVSKNIIDFALKNNAKFINIENLSKEGFDDRVLRNWSYFELQTMIEYKAKQYGIEVRNVNPYHTSQSCSKCNHWEEGQRINQSEFECKECGYKANADFNAARNIALSVNFVE